MKSALLKLEKRLSALARESDDVFTHSFEAGDSQWTIRSTENELMISKDGGEFYDVTPTYEEIYNKHSGPEFWQVVLGWLRIHRALTQTHDSFVDTNNMGKWAQEIPNLPYDPEDRTQKRIRTYISNLLQAPVVDEDHLRFECVELQQSSTSSGFNRPTHYITDVQIFRISIKIP